MTATQAAIAKTPEELDETPFISSVVAPNPSREEAAALYDPTAPTPPRTVVTEAAVEAPVVKVRSGNTVKGPERKGGWPKGKPRKPKVDVVDTNGQI
ncbi:MAG: hypothetical protein EOO61_20005 [Hymenobacter sp.]|nr:MAG: hypothetical protein EOO61_20005 [Hymenobacter sp.]